MGVPLQGQQPLMAQGQPVRWGQPYYVRSFVFSAFIRRVDIEAEHVSFSTHILENYMYGA